MKAQFTFHCNGEAPWSSDVVTLNVNTTEANLMNYIESEATQLHSQHKPGFLDVNSIYSTEYPYKGNLRDKTLTFIEEDKVYHFTIFGKYNKKGGRKSRKSRKNRKSRRR